MINWKNEEINLKRYLETDKKPIDEVANLYGVSVSTIRLKCRQFNIKIPPNKMTKLTLSQKQEFIKLFVEGKPKAELKSLFSLSENAYNSLLYRLKLKRTNRNYWTSIEIKKLRDLLKKKKSYKELEIEFKGRHSIQSISDLIRDKGDKLDLHYQGNIRHKFTKEEDQKILHLVKEGNTAKEISRILGIKEESIKSVLKRYNEKPLTEKEKQNLGKIRGKSKKFLTKEKVIEALKENRYHRKNSANYLGISVDTLKRRIKFFNIEIPKKKTKKEKASAHTALLTKLLGHKPQKEEIHLKIKDILNKTKIEKALELNNYHNPSTAKYLGISLSLLGKLKREFGIKNKIIHTTDYSVEFYRKAYMEDGLTLKEISGITGLSVETLRKYIKRILPDSGKFGRFSSSGEFQVAKALEKLEITYIYNKRYKEGNPKKLYIIDFEFSYKNNLYWIEFNGKQHYEFIEYFYKTHEKFEERLERDKTIEKLSKDKGIKLIIIKYDVPNILEKIKQEI